MPTGHSVLTLLPTGKYIIMTSALSDKDAYWNAFYASTARGAPQKPSQFAAFVAGEAAGVPAIVEMGCGNGRDAEFFGHLGFDVLATDASPEAIALCQSRSRNAHVRYACIPAHQSKDLVAEFAQKHVQFCVYGRFFLHAISEKRQAELLLALDESLPKGCLLAFEYRTTLDAQDDKAFGDHYRRFLDHGAFIETLDQQGYEVLYQIEGQGFAKYKSEDAFVGRIIARRR